MAHGKKHDRPSADKQSGSVSQENATGPRLKAFYVELSSNLDKFSSFVADPRGFAEREGLSKEEMDLLFSADQGRIYASLRPDLVASPPPTPPNPGPAGAQAAPAPASPVQPQGYSYAMPWSVPYGYSYGWPSYWPASSCPGQDAYLQGMLSAAQQQEVKR